MKLHHFGLTLLALIFVALVMCGSGLAETLKLPVDVREIEEEAFYGNTSLNEVVLPDGIQKIGPRAFAGSSVQRVYFPQSLTDIADDAFSGAGSVTGYGLPGTYAARYCESHNIPYEYYSTPVEEFTFEFPNAVEATITGWTGEGEYVAIPDMADDSHQITAIGNSVFKDKSSLKGIVFADSIISIGKDAFLNCVGLTNIALPSDLETIGANAFKNCTKLVDVEFNDGLTTIYDGAFSCCTSLIDADLPDSVETLGVSTYYLVDAGVFANDTSLVSFHYPLSLHNVADNVGPLSGCTKLKSVTIQEGVESLCPRIFKNAASLTEINLPSTLEEIGSQAFAYCTGLPGIELPNAVYTIRDRAFKGCTGLTVFEMPADLETIEFDAFMDCTNITNITLNDALVTIGANAFKNCTKLVDVEFNDGLTTIYDGAFSYCTSLIDADLPDSVETLGVSTYPTADAGVFANDTSLVSFHYPLSLHNVADNGDWRFGPLSGCTNLKSVTIQEGVESLCPRIFRNANGLTSINLPSTLRNIEYEAFRGATALREVWLPNGLRTIGNRVFYDCSALRMIYIPSSITDFGSELFVNTHHKFEIWTEYGSSAVDYAVDNSHDYYYLTPVGTNLSFSTIYNGEGRSLIGWIYSTVNITEINAVVTDSSGANLVSSVVNPAATTYDLSGDINSALNLSALPVGSYHFRLSASTAKSTEVYADHDFTVAVAPLRIRFNDFAPPSGFVDRETAAPLNGTISANYPITSLSVAVGDENGDSTNLSYLASPNANSFSMAQTGIDLRELVDGGYDFRLELTANGETRTAALTNFVLGSGSDYTVIESRDDIVSFANSDDSDAVFHFDKLYEFTKYLENDDGFQATNIAWQWKNRGKTLRQDISGMITNLANEALGEHTYAKEEYIEIYTKYIMSYIKSNYSDIAEPFTVPQQTLLDKIASTMYKTGKVGYGDIKNEAAMCGADIEDIAQQVTTLMSFYKYINLTQNSVELYMEFMNEYMLFCCQGISMLDTLTEQVTSGSDLQTENFQIAVQRLKDKYKSFVLEKLKEVLKSKATDVAAGKVEDALTDLATAFIPPAGAAIKLSDFVIGELDKYTPVFNQVKAYEAFSEVTIMYSEVAEIYYNCREKIRNGDTSEERLKDFKRLFNMTKYYALQCCNKLKACDSDYYFDHTALPTKASRLEKINCPR